MTNAWSANDPAGGGIDLDAGRARVWTRAAAAVVVMALLVQVHNAFLHLPLDDFDASGHAVNIFALREGRLPAPNVWSGFHPILQHALGAGLWGVLPEGVPLHVVLRLISVVATFLTVWIIWRCLRRLLPEADAAIATAALACAPGVMVNTGMMGNEPLCALLIAAVLARLLGLGRGEAPGTGHAAVTGLLAALAATAKASGLISVGVAGLAYAIVLRRQPSRAIASMSVVAVLAALLAGPHYLRLAAAGDGSTSSFFFAGAAVDGDLRAVAEIQPPGERHLPDYWSVPAETFTLPDARVAALNSTVPGLLYASAWAGAQSPYLRRADLVEQESLGVRRSKSILAFLGLLPTALLALGLVQIARRRELRERVVFPMVLLALLAVSFLRYTWSYPIFTTVKASFLLPGLLPLGVMLAAGLSCLKDGLRGPVRAALLVICLVQVGAIWQGWWSDAPPDAPEVVRDQAQPYAEDHPGRTVERYFKDRVCDPIRSLDLLTEAFHDSHGLRVSRLFAGRRIRNAGQPGDPTEIERAKLAWLTFLSMHWVVERLAVQQITIFPPEINGDRALVGARILGGDGPAFGQAFELSRSGSGAPWRIDRIRQKDVQPSNMHEARAAGPTMEIEEAVKADADG